MYAFQNEFDEYLHDANGENGQMEHEEGSLIDHMNQLSVIDPQIEIANEITNTPSEDADFEATNEMLVHGMTCEVVSIFFLY